MLVSLQSGFITLFCHMLTASCQRKNVLFLQAVFKNMTHMGLLPTFRENHAFTLWLELCMAIPLLPEHDIEEAWNELKTMPVPDVPKKLFLKLKKYITKTWIQQRLNVLSVHGQKFRTNNSVESYNSRWNQRVGIKGPNMWMLCDKIWEVFEVSYGLRVYS